MKQTSEYGPNCQVMSTGPHRFKLSESARLIRAAQAAGLRVTGVTLDGSKITVLVDDGDRPTSEKSHDEVENWVRKHHANQR
jgi:hypothetical protein